MFVSLALLTPSASACGGFFCNNVPVDQQGEDILFAVDKERNETTVHVQITYTGAAEDFAWVVPVPQVPEIVLSSDVVFRELLWRTGPRFGLVYKELWSCQDDRIWSDATADYAYSASSSAAPPSDGGVQVIEQGRVGPYETAILAASSSEALLDWLQTNDYDLPDSLDPVLAPYVASQSFFVALKLAKEQDTGALQPLALKYAGAGASVPIQLTSIAATPDMRLHVYLLGDSRAVPDSYYHVKVNELVVDWFSGGANYEAAITVAADEAGGHAFATDYSGTSDLMDDALYQDGRFDTAALAASSDAYEFFDRLLEQGFVGDDQMLALFREFLPMPQALVNQGVEEQDFYNCLSCYSSYVDAIPFDAAAFAAAIEERIVVPLRDAQALFDRFPHLTRLTSSVSPVEMTVDPTFVFNDDMEQGVAIDRTATLEILCGFGGQWSESPRRLVLPDGRAYDLPSERWFQEQGISEYQYLEELMDVYALVIEETGEEGEPVVIADFTDEAFAAAEAFNRDEESARGCGCGGGAPVGALAAGLALVGLGVRRRR